ncbi:iron ABC transporter substrate-binding protein, partial [Acinetobacter baumannii]
MTAPLLRASLPALACLVLALGPASAGGEVNIYSYREPKLMNPLLKAFTAKTGIKANMIYTGSGLVERISAEGRNSP